MREENFIYITNISISWHRLLSSFFQWKKVTLVRPVFMASGETSSLFKSSLLSPELAEGWGWSEGLPWRGK